MTHQRHSYKQTSRLDQNDQSTQLQANKLIVTNNALNATTPMNKTNKYAEEKNTNILLTEEVLCILTMATDLGMSSTSNDKYRYQMKL